jgi:Zn-dependent peptidase ImmA (M78 family)/transcriptional regulator with XRE-family HTH domain
MSDRATALNPAILIWARERAGLSLAAAAAQLGKAEADLAAWEAGESSPTYVQLETLAERVYRRPVAMFFLRLPPAEAPVRREFRTLPDAEIESLDADTLYAIRDARAYQDSFRELSGGVNLAERQLLSDIRAHPEDDPAVLAAAVRKYLGITATEQQSWPDTRAAMTAWRVALEAVGVLVLKRSFDQREISGFCLDDPQFPLIVVNNSTPFARQVFTLFHELAHLLFGVSTLTKEGAGFLARLDPEVRRLEMACNRFAAELLVPPETVPWAEFEPNSVADFAARMARRYRVSREVILRRLLDRGMIAPSTYSTFVEEWNRDIPPRAGGGGNYYATQWAYLGPTFLGLAFTRYRQGAISLAELAEHTRVRAKNLAKLETYLLERV